jgi:hypothetical protein
VNDSRVMVAQKTMYARGWTTASMHCRPAGVSSVRCGAGERVY